MMKRLLVLLVLVIGIGALIFGETTISFWTENTQPYQVKILQTLINEFETQNPGIKVTYQLVPWSVYLQKFQTALETNQTPVVSQLGTTKMPFFYEKGGLIDLSTYVEKSTLDKDIVPSAWDTCKYDGGIYGVPWIIDSRYTIYRKDWFEEKHLPLPTNSWTWQDFVEDAQKLTNPEKYIYGAGVAYDTGDDTGEQNFWSVFTSLGGEVFKDGKVVFNSSVALNAVKIYTDLFLKYHVTPPSAPSLTGPDLMRLLANGNVGIIYSTNVETYAQAVDANPSLKDELGLVLNPQINGKSAAFLGGSDLVMWKGHSQEEYEAAWKWIEFLMSTDVQAKYALQLTGSLPAIESAYSSEYFMNDLPALKPYKQILEEAVAYGVPEPNVTVLPVMESAFAHMLNSVVLGTPIDVAVKRADDQISAAWQLNK